MIALLLARFRRKPQPTPTHPSVGLIRTERNTDPVCGACGGHGRVNRRTPGEYPRPCPVCQPAEFGTDTAFRVLLDDERKAARRAQAEATLRRAGIEGRAS